MAKSLYFNKEGLFTIAQFTDIHWKDGSGKDQLSRAVMEQVLRHEKPDLVVFTGDIIYTGYVSAGERVCTDPVKALLEAVDTVESAGIPWAYTFGNHDAEPESPATKEDLMKAILGTTHSVTPPASDQGPGTYKLEVLGADNQVSAALFILDSGNRSPLSGLEGYAWVGRDQIRWFEQESLALPRLADGKAVPSCAFFHIPLPEYREMWETQVCYGHRYETVCCPPLNSGLFAAMVELGHTLGVFVGHDHVNDYWGELHGIRLCYGRASGHHTYGREGFPRGARMIRLYEGERRLDTWLRLEDGTLITEQPRHEPEKL